MQILWDLNIELLTVLFTQDMYYIRKSKSCTTWDICNNLHLPNNNISTLYNANKIDKTMDLIRFVLNIARKKIANYSQQFSKSLTLHENLCVYLFLVSVIHSKSVGKPCSFTKPYLIFYWLLNNTSKYNVQKHQGYYFMPERQLTIQFCETLIQQTSVSFCTKLAINLAFPF